MFSLAINPYGFARLNRIIGALLGGTAGYLSGTKGKDAEKDPYGQLNPEQRATNMLVGAKINSVIDKGPQFYGQEMTAGMSPEEAALYNPSRVGAMSGMLDQNIQASMDPTALNEQFNREMATPTYQDWEQNVAPQIGESMSNFGTARAQALARSQGDVSRSLQQQRFAATQAAKDRGLTSMGKYADVSAFAATPRAFQQAGLDRKYSDFVRGNQEYASNIDRSLNFLGISTGTYMPEVKDTRWSGALSGFMQGASMESNMAGNFMGMGGGGGGGYAGSGTMSGMTPSGAGNSAAAAPRGSTPQGVSRTQFINGVPYTM